MRLRGRLLCLLGRHARIGRLVYWDGRDFRSVCRHCGVQLYKHGNVRWRRVARVKRAELMLLSYNGDPSC